MRRSPLYDPDALLESYTDETADILDELDIEDVAEEYSLDELVHAPYEAEPELDTDGELEVGEDLLSDEGEESESWSDDPVRMYLTQMGEIPS